MFFKSTEHYQGFIDSIKILGKVYEGKCDPEYASAIYILTSDMGIWNQVARYISREGIDWATIFNKVDLSGGYSVLLRLACNLFNRGNLIDPVEIPTRLDDANFKLALTALQIRRHNLPLAAFQPDSL